jgi:hypothetical protein
MSSPRLESDNAARQAWVNYWGKDVLHQPEFASARDWSAKLPRRCENEALRVGKHDDDPNGVAVPCREAPGWLKAPNVCIHKAPSGRLECVVHGLLGS